MFLSDTTDIYEQTNQKVHVTRDFLRIERAITNAHPYHDMIGHFLESLNFAIQFCLKYTKECISRTTNVNLKLMK